MSFPNLNLNQLNSIASQQEAQRRSLAVLHYQGAMQIFSRIASSDFAYAKHKLFEKAHSLGLPTSPENEEDKKEMQAFLNDNPVNIDLTMGLQFSIDASLNMMAALGFVELKPNPPERGA